jgi:putative ABC transport system permease protein
MEFVEGRAPQKGEVALDISSLALVSVNIGDEIIYRDGTGREKRLTVVGLARSPAYPSAAILQAAVAYASSADVRTMLGTPNGDNEVLVRLDSLAGRDETRRQIEDVFRKRNISFGDARIRDRDNYLGKSELNTLILMLLFFSTVGLVISGFLVANTLSAIVTEQMGEIGTLKALGGSRWQVLQIYLWAGFIYGAIGSLFGILAGFALGKLLLGYLGGTVNFDVDRFLFQPEALALGLLVGIGVTIFAALLPAWNGTRISVRQAIASYGIQSNYGQGRLDKALAKLRHMPPLVLLSLRNLTRRKTRNIITFGVVALSCAAFLAAQSASASLDRTITSLYAIYGADAWVGFEGRLNNNFADRIGAVEGVRLSEPWSRGRGTVKASGVDLWGMPYDTQLYKKPVVSGRWFAPDDNNVALATTALAKAKNINVGDTIEIEAGRVREQVLIIGLLEDNSRYLNSTAAGKLFLPNTTVERMFRHQGTSDFFAVGLVQSDKEFVLQTMREIERRFRDFKPNILTAYADKVSAEQITGILQLMLYSMVAIIALIGIIGVVNTLTLNVLERRREIGILRSVGGSDGRLVQIFVTEGVFLGLLGFIFGLGLGYPLALLLVSLIGQAAFPLVFVFDLPMILLTFGFAVALSAVASLGPALGAARVKIASTIRYG